MTQATYNRVSVLSSDKNPLSRDTSNKTNEQSEKKETDTAKVNKLMTGQGKQNRRRKTRQGPLQPCHERTAEQEPIK